MQRVMTTPEVALEPPAFGVAGCGVLGAVISSFLFGYSICVLNSCMDLIAVPRGAWARPVGAASWLRDLASLSGGHAQHIDTPRHRKATPTPTQTNET